MIANRYEQELEDVQEWLSLTEWSQENISEATIIKVQDQLFDLNIISTECKAIDSKVAVLILLVKQISRWISLLLKCFIRLLSSTHRTP